MKKSLAMLLVAGAMLSGLAGTANAGGNWGVSMTWTSGGPAIVCPPPAPCPPPVIVQPRPVICRPPVVVTPRPVIYRPPIVVQPRPIICRPPIVVRRPPVICHPQPVPPRFGGPGHGHYTPQPPRPTHGGGWDRGRR